MCYDKTGREQHITKISQTVNYSVDLTSCIYYLLQLKYFLKLFILLQLFHIYLYDKLIL